jgi:hypothetical protein
MGLDCHRTWEALALGHIVLVPSSSLNSLYDGLAAVPLKNWNEITAENLQTWLLQDCQNDGKVQPKLASKYWLDQMKMRLEQ